MVKSDSNKAFFNIEFKALPVYHAPHAPGSCLFIFNISSEKKRIVTSGDFESIRDEIIRNGDLLDPSLILLETNTIYATRTSHTNWLQNEKLLNYWITGQNKVKVLINHLSGFEDWEQGYFPDIPGDSQWEKAISSFCIQNAQIEIAADGRSYPVP